MDGKRKMPLYSLESGHQRFRSTDMSNPVDIRGRAIGVTRHGGERRTVSHPQEIDVFPSNLQADKKGHGLRASLKTNEGIGGQKFIWYCHNTAARQHNLININSFAGGTTVLFSVENQKN